MIVPAFFHSRLSADEFADAFRERNERVEIRQGHGGYIVKPHTHLSEREVGKLAGKLGGRLEHL